MSHECQIIPSVVAFILARLKITSEPILTLGTVKANTIFFWVNGTLNFRLSLYNSTEPFGGR